MGTPPVRPVGMCQRHLRVERPVTWLPIPESWWYTTQTGVEWQAMWLCNDCAAKAERELIRVDEDRAMNAEPLKIDGFEYPSERVQEVIHSVVQLADIARAGHDSIGESALADAIRLLVYLAQTLKDQGR